MVELGTAPAADTEGFVPASGGRPSAEPACAGTAAPEAGCGHGTTRENYWTSRVSS